MGSPYQETGGEFDYDTEWKELLDPAAEDNISNSAMEAVLVGTVPWGRQRAAARFFLGYSYADTAAPWRLHREPPAAHPRWPNLYAHGISFRGWSPKSNSVNANGEPFEESEFDDGQWTSHFELAVTTVRFRSFGRTRFLPDDHEAITTPGDEYKRYTSFTTAPSIEALSSDGASQLTFAEGVIPLLGPTGKAFPAPITTLLSKTRYVLQWLHLPHEFLSTDPEILVPTRILNCVGKVNSTGFLGFRAGELLMEPPTFEPVLFPVCAEDSFELITGWNAAIPLQYFSPEKGVANDPPGTSPYYGHNLMPWRIDGKFYHATRDGTAAGRTLLPSADFNDIWKHVSAP